jgi:hypothetical protein
MIILKLGYLNVSIITHRHNKFIRFTHSVIGTLFLVDETTSVKSASLGETISGGGVISTTFRCIDCIPLRPPGRSIDEETKTNYEWAHEDLHKKYGLHPLQNGCKGRISHPWSRTCSC